MSVIQHIKLTPFHEWRKVCHHHKSEQNATVGLKSSCGTLAAAEYILATKILP